MKFMDKNENPGFNISGFYIVDRSKKEEIERLKKYWSENCAPDITDPPGFYRFCAEIDGEIVNEELAEYIMEGYLNGLRYYYTPPVSDWQYKKQFITIVKAGVFWHNHILEGIKISSHSEFIRFFDKEENRKKYIVEDFYGNRYSLEEVSDIIKKMEQKIRLKIKDFKAVAADEITAEINLWGQDTALVLCVELEEDRGNEKRYIRKALKYIKENIERINDRVEYIAENKDRIIEELMQCNPLDMVQCYLENRLNDAAADHYVWSDSTEIRLPVTEADFLEKLLVCECISMEIDVTDEEDEPDIAVTVSFGAADDLLGGHGWDIEVDED